MIDDTHATSAGRSQKPTAIALPLTSMRRMSIVLFLAVLIWPTSPIAGQKPPHYGVVKRIEFDSGGAEFLTVDPDSRRLFADYRVVNIDDYRVVGQVPDHTGHGYALAPALGRAVGRHGIVFDLKTLASVSQFPVEGETVVYDSLSRRAFIVGDTTAVIDVEHGTLVARLPLGQGIVGGASDNHGRVFLSALRDNAIVVLDARNAAVITRWTDTGCEGPDGMIVDVVHDRLFVSCNNLRLIILQATTGRVVAALPTSGLAVSMAYDPDLRLLFHPNSRNTLSTFQEIDPDHFRMVETVPTDGAEQTIALDSKTHRVFLYKHDGWHLTIITMGPLLSTQESAAPSGKSQ